MVSIGSRLPVILAIAAGLGMIFATAWQAHGFWQSATVTETGASRSVIRNNGQADRQVPELALGSVQMFGNEEQAAAPEADIDNLPETNLKLVLRGVMSASGDFPGSALVEDNKRQTEAFIVGDELPGNATLRTVRPDRIIIERSGVRESLFFPDDEDRSGMNLAASNSPSRGDGSPTGNAQQQARPASFPGPETGQSSNSRREQIRQRLEQLRNRLRNNN
jgi:general secretion pathway protein C